MKHCFIIAALLFYTNLSAQYASLYMSTPRGNFISMTGTVEDAVAYCEISGSHLKTDLYLTFSTKASNVVSNDSLELRAYFTLPPQSFVTDLWLWIGEDTSIAIIADKFKAQATYNNIVGARKDPALLTKNYGDSYNLQIFPFTLPGKRKIKMTYSSPLSIVDSTISVPLPYWFLQASAPYNATPFTVFLKQNPQWHSPQVRGNTVFGFTPVNDAVFGNVLRCDIHRDSINAARQLSLVVNSARSVISRYAEKFQTGNTGTYRFVVEPFQSLGINPGKNMLLLADFDPSNVVPQFTKAMLLAQIKKSITAKFTKKDSFNIIFTAKNGMKYLSQQWIPVDSASIENAFASVTDLSAVLDTVDLAGLLRAGFTFAKKYPSTNGIILFASSDEYTSLSAANALVDTMMKIAPPKVRFFTIDNNDSAQYFYGSTYYYYGNGYLYSQLIAKFSGASYRVYNSYMYDYNSLEYFTGLILDAMRWQIEYFGLTVYLKSGYTYQNYYSLGKSANISLNSTVSQSGKFIGSFPMNIEVTGFYEGKLYTNTIVLQDSDFVAADSNLNKVWANQMLSQFSSSYYTRNEQAVNLSIQNRILTYWTALLALEKGQKLCDTCFAWSGGVVVTDVRQPSTSPSAYEIIQAYPNPFNPSTTLRVRLPYNIESKDVTLTIYNILGQAVRSFDVTELTDRQERNIVWDGRDLHGTPVSSGVYLAVVTTPQKRFSVKLLLMK
jgi:hypothetical protein